MTGLLDLAPEILGHIVKSIQVYPFAHDTILYKLALTCRTLYQVTEPFLYKKIVRRPSTELAKLLRTLLDRPEYAKRVKYMSVSLWDENDSNPEQDVDRIHGQGIMSSEENEAAHWLSMFPQLGLVGLSSAQWTAALRDGKLAALSALVVLLLPNLQELEFNILYYDHDPSLHFPNTILAGSLSHGGHIYFQHLQEVRIYRAAAAHCLGTEELVPLFYLPAIRKLQIFDARFDSFEFSPPLLSCPVEEIEFASSGISSDAAAEMFSSTRNLKSFTYEIGNPKYVGMEDQTDMASVGQNLHLVSSTLESLQLSEEYGDTSNLESIPSLHQFPRLSKIIIDPCMMMTSKIDSKLWEVLPSVIEELEFLNHDYYRGGGIDEEALASGMVELVLRKEEKFPALRKVVWPRMNVEFKELCLSQGIEFT